jgi:hypothetical protein
MKIDKNYLLLLLYWLFYRIVLWFANSNIFGRYTRYLGIQGLYSIKLFYKHSVEFNSTEKVSVSLYNAVRLRISFNYIKLYISNSRLVKSQFTKYLFERKIYLTKHSELFRDFLNIFKDINLFYVPERFKTGYFNRPWFMLFPDILFCFIPGCAFFPTTKLFLIIFRIFVFLIKFILFCVNFPIITIFKYFAKLDIEHGKPFAPFNIFTYDSIAALDGFKLLIVPIIVFFVLPFRFIYLLYHKYINEFYINYFLPAFGYDVLLHGKWLLLITKFTGLALCWYIQFLIIICNNPYVPPSIHFIYLSIIIWIYLYSYFIVSNREQWIELLEDCMWIFIFGFVIYMLAIDFYRRYNPILAGRTSHRSVSLGELFVKHCVNDVFVGNYTKHTGGGAEHTLQVNDLRHSINTSRKYTVRRNRKKVKIISKLIYHSLANNAYGEDMLFYLQNRERYIIAKVLDVHWLNVKKKPHFFYHYRQLFKGDFAPPGSDRFIGHLPGDWEYFRGLDTNYNKLLKYFEEECTNIPFYATRYDCGAYSWDYFLLNKYSPLVFNGKELPPSNELVSLIPKTTHKPKTLFDYFKTPYNWLTGSSS